MLLRACDSVKLATFELEEYYRSRTAVGDQLVIERYENIVTTLDYSTICLVKKERML